MGLFDGLRKRGRPRKKFTLEESKEIILSTLGRMVHTEIDWESHRQVKDNVFLINVKYISLYSLEILLKHKNIRDVYFNSLKFNGNYLVLKLVYG